MNTKTLIFVNNEPAKFFLDKIDHHFAVIVTLNVKETAIELSHITYGTFYEALSVLLEKLMNANVSEQTSRVDEVETGFDLATLQRMINELKKSEQ